MSTTPLAPRKSMSASERRLLKTIAAEMQQSSTGKVVMAELLRLIASWMGSPSPAAFQTFAVQWLDEGNAENSFAAEMLKDIFGTSGPSAA